MLKKKDGAPDNNGKDNGYQTSPVRAGKKNARLKTNRRAVIQVEILKVRHYVIENRILPETEQSKASMTRPGR